MWFVKIAEDIDSVKTTEDFNLKIEEDGCYNYPFDSPMLEYQKDGKNFIVLPSSSETMKNEGVKGLKNPINTVTIGYWVAQQDEDGSYTLSYDKCEKIGLKKAQ